MNVYSVDFKLKIVKMILNDHISKKSIMKEYNVTYGEDHTILHSDQGRVYSSVKFEKMHQTYPITRSMSRTGTPIDNPVIESLIGWIKGDLKHHLKPHDFNDVNKAIEVYINYFNHHRVAYRLFNTC